MIRLPDELRQRHRLVLSCESVASVQFLVHTVSADELPSDGATTVPDVTGDQLVHPIGAARLS